MHEKAVKAPKASKRNGSTIEAGYLLWLTCSTPGATIYYTLDGSCPCNETTRIKYIEPFKLPVGQVTLKAVAVRQGMEDSDVTTLNYTVIGEEPGLKEAYAVLDAGVLTFHYDMLKERANGVVYPIEKDYTYYQLPAWHADRSKINTGAFDASFADYSPTNTSYWFYKLDQMATLSNTVNLNTSDVTKMEFMFYGCENLTSLDISHFNTSKVTTMWMMFAYCQKLQTIAVNVFDTRNVNGMYGMFWGCWNLTKLDVSGFNTSKVTNMAGMFYDWAPAGSRAVGRSSSCLHPQHPCYATPAYRRR